MKILFGLPSLTKILTIAFSKPHSWFLELLYLIINGSINRRFNQITRTQIWGWFQKLIRMRPNCTIQKFQLCIEAAVPKTKNTASGTPRDTPFRQRRASLLAQEHWQEWSGWPDRRTHFTPTRVPSKSPGELRHGGSPARTKAPVPSAASRPGSNYVAGHRGRGTVQNFKTQGWENQHTYQRGLYKWHLGHGSGNLWQSSLNLFS